MRQQPVALLGGCAALFGFSRGYRSFLTAANVLPPGIHPSAVVDPSANIAVADAHVGAHVVIERDVTIEAGAVVQANCSIGNNSIIGGETKIFPNVVVYQRVSLGQRCTVHSGAVLGADGFGFTPDEQGRFEAIAQIGGLRIGSDVSIGAGTTIDCGAIDATVIGDGVKIDNLVQIGHNCKIGDHTSDLWCGRPGWQYRNRPALCASRRQWCWGEKPDQNLRSSCRECQNTVTQSIDKPGVYSGSVIAAEHGTWMRNVVKFNSLGELFKRVKKLEDGIKDE